MAKRPTHRRVKKARSTKTAPSRVRPKPLGKAQRDPNWKKKSKWGKVKKYVAKPSQINWKLARRKKIQERHEHEGKSLRSRLYTKLDQFKKEAKRSTVKNIGHAYRIIILADADFGMSNPAIADEAAFNLQYWTTTVVRTREESKDELIDLLRRAEEQVSDFASFEVLKVIRLQFHVNKDGSYSVTEHASRTPAFKLWRPE
jgi:hypothetical protein